MPPNFVHVHHENKVKSNTKEQWPLYWAQLGQPSQTTMKRTMSYKVTRQPPPRLYSDPKSKIHKERSPAGKFSNQVLYLLLRQPLELKLLLLLLLLLLLRLWLAAGDCFEWPLQLSMGGGGLSYDHV